MTNESKTPPETDVPCPFPECDGVMVRACHKEHWYTCHRCGFESPSHATPEAALDAVKRVRVMPEGAEVNEDVAAVREYYTYASDPIAQRVFRICDLAELADSYRAEAERAKEERKVDTRLWDAQVEHLCTELDKARAHLDAIAHALHPLPEPYRPEGE